MLAQLPSLLVEPKGMFRISLRMLIDVNYAYKKVDWVTKIFPEFVSKGLVT